MTRTALLSDAEIAKRCKVPGFGAYLQAEWARYKLLMDLITEGARPEKAELVEMVEWMEDEKLAFDYSYFHQLPAFPTNPLEAEQTAWKAPSPRIESFLGKFRVFLEHYPSSEVWREELTRHIETWWRLLQEWNAISKSYKRLYS